MLFWQHGRLVRKTVAEIEAMNQLAEQDIIVRKEAGSGLPAVPTGPRIAAAEVADQVTGCDCGHQHAYHDWWCSWWDHHPEAHPF